MDPQDPQAKAPPPAMPPIYSWPGDPPAQVQAPQVQQQQQQVRQPAAPQPVFVPSYDPHAHELELRMMRDAHRARGTRLMITGGLIALLGIIITAATYSSASESGGTYIVAYGPIAGGVITFFRGVAAAAG